MDYVSKYGSTIDHDIPCTTQLYAQTQIMIYSHGTRHNYNMIYHQFNQ